MYIIKGGYIKMANEIKVFENPEFGQVRTVIINDEPWFVAIDVCKALELTNPSISLSRLDDDERAKFNLGRQGETNIINEPGLYTLVLGSRKPEAKTFKRWITHEVIPSIRKTGGYQVPMSNVELLSRAVLAANEELAKLQSKVEEQETEIADKSLQLEEKISVNKALTEDITVADKRKRISSFVKSGYSIQVALERWNFFVQ